MGNKVFNLLFVWVCFAKRVKCDAMIENTKKSSM